jgi:hypothetical protein
METAVLAAVALLCLAWVLAPVLIGGRARLAVSRGDTAIGRQELRKNLILENIADLDFEYAMGKLSDEDYRDLRDSLKAQAAQFTEQIDVLQHGDANPDRASVAAEGPHGARPRPGAAATAEPVVVADAHHGNGSDTVRATAGRFCIGCGAGLPSEARFCPACGKQVTA